MDPFVVVSFGKKVFRTRVIRHSRNPVWEEKLLFHVRRYETKFDVRLTVLDWDKISSNDHIGDATFPVHELVAQAPQKDEKTGLYEMRNDGHGEMKEYVLPLTTGKEMPWESKHNPQIVVKSVHNDFRYRTLLTIIL
jgi:phosphatidylserine decarboxylase